MEWGSSYLAGTRGPKIAAELVGAAKTAIMGKKSSWLSEAMGQKHS